MKEHAKMSVYQILTALIIAAILNLNIFRIVLRTPSSAITYPVFAVFFLLIVMQYGKKEYYELNLPVAAALSLYLIWSVVSLFIFGGSYISELIKFIISLGIGYLASLSDERTRSLSFDISIIISALYSIYAVIYHNNIYRSLIRNGLENYLTITISMGFGLTLAIISLITEKESWKRRTLYISAALAQTLGLLNYSARGNLIFPFIVSAAFLIYDSKTSFLSLLRNSLFIIIAGLSAYYLFTSFASEKLVMRLTRLFASAEQEGRVPIYRLFLKDIWDNTRFFIGNGFGRSANLLKDNGFSEHYPHNFILELVSEGGIFGILLIGTTVFETFRSSRIIANSLRKDNTPEGRRKTRTVYLITSGLLFFVLNYFKSYSIYDGYQMFIFIGMIMHTELLLQNKEVAV